MSDLIGYTIILLLSIFGAYLLGSDPVSGSILINGLLTFAVIDLLLLIYYLFVSGAIPIFAKWDGYERLSKDEAFMSGWLPGFVQRMLRYVVRSAVILYLWLWTNAGQLYINDFSLVQYALVGLIVILLFHKRTRV